MKKSKLIKILALISFVVVITLIGKYYYDKSFTGNEQIQLITNSDEIKTLEDLITRKEFVNSVLYIDIWGTSCGPCINEFKYVPELKERYKGKQIKFIYLSTPYLHFNDEQKWKNMIRKHNLAGFHSLISVELYDNIMKREGIKSPYLIPHYILVDKQGKIVELNALRPSKKKELYNQIDKIL